MGLRLRDRQTGRIYEWPVGSSVTVGREDVLRPDWRPEVLCNDKHVSRLHCTVVVRREGFEVQDSSAYGTFINRQRVAGQALARAGDVLVLGHEYALEVLPAEETASGLVQLDERFEAHRELARGGMGVVYEGYDRHLARRCALKLLLAGGRASDSLCQRFRREAVLSARLADCPGIVSIYAMGVSLCTGQLFCAMDFVEGSTLRQRIRAGLDRAQGVRWIADVARAVAFAHAQDVLHRDLKPENVLVSSAGQARLTDFGISRALDEGGGLTATGITLGTPGYMAPEQARSSRDVGPLADVYGLGGILYYLLTRRPPYVGASVADVLLEVKAGSLVPPSRVDPSVDPGLEAICQRALASDPAQRFPSAQAFGEALERWTPLAPSAPTVQLDTAPPAHTESGERTLPDEPAETDSGFATEA
ncbi:MAG TPA: hypothetical protein DEA08_25020 [Planctomycetes bacterium]|nr:hypothetical protein [Planctomycetota bacterium]